MESPTIETGNLSSFVRLTSGIFITKENPQGLSPKECIVLGTLLSVVGDAKITKETKVDVSNLLNQSLQVTTNYLAKFRKKGAVTKENKINSLLLHGKLTIEWKREL